MLADNFPRQGEFALNKMKSKYSLTNVTILHQLFQKPLVMPY